MPTLGPLEILVILVVALLVFGPKKLPDIARQVGKGMSEFRRVQHQLRRELDDAVHSVMDEDTTPGETPAADAVDVNVSTSDGPSAAALESPDGAGAKVADPAPDSPDSPDVVVPEIPAPPTGDDVPPSAEDSSSDPAEPDTR